MSLRNIIGSVNNLDNKSLNIKCNSVEAYSIQGGIVSDDIQCETLIVDNAVTLRSSFWPPISLNPYSFLCDIDGNGDLQYVDVSNTGKIENGTYLSNITSYVSVGINNVNETSQPTYTKIGDTVTISGSFRGDVVADTIYVYIKTIPGTANSNTQISITGNSNNNEISLLPLDVIVSPSNVIGMIWKSVNNASITPANMTNTLFYYTVTYRNNV